MALFKFDSLMMYVEIRPRIKVLLRTAFTGEEWKASNYGPPVTASSCGTGWLDFTYCTIFQNNHTDNMK